MGAGAAAIATRPVFAPGRQFALGAMAPVSQAADVFLNYNESPYGPSPMALDAIRNASTAVISRYFPEDTYDTLRDTLATHHGVTRAHIRIGAGSTEILKVCDDIFLSSRPPLVADVAAAIRGRSCRKSAVSGIFTASALLLAAY